LLSARIEGDLNAEPGPDGTIPIALVPNDNNQAIMTNQWLTPDEAKQLTVAQNEDRHDGASPV
jgi:hypothetical protein